MAFDIDQITIEPISRTHERSAFVCKNKVLQTYCQKYARQNNDAYKNRAFVACMPQQRTVFGFYYLSLTSYRIGESQLDDRADRKFSGAKSAAVPAVYIGMLAVHQDYEGRGLGTLMMQDALIRTVRIAEQAGVYALALDAIDEATIPYYRNNFGFSTFKLGGGLEMFLPLRTILENFGAKST